MKTIYSAIAVALSFLTACNNNKTPDATGINKDASATTATDTANVQKTAAFPVKEIVAVYLELKNALAKDNDKDAAAAGNALASAFAKIDMRGLTKEQMKSYMDVADDVKENAEHIGASAGKIEHQREHFEALSEDIADLVKTFGTGGQSLYKDFCPMANNGKGAIWISEIKEIRNPYFGNQMPTCGSVKEMLK